MFRILQILLEMMFNAQLLNKMRQLMNSLGWKKAPLMLDDVWVVALFVSPAIIGITY